MNFDLTDGDKLLACRKVLAEKFANAKDAKAAEPSGRSSSCDGVDS